MFLRNIWLIISLLLFCIIFCFGRAIEADKHFIIYIWLWKASENLLKMYVFFKKNYPKQSNLCLTLGYVLWYPNTSSIILFSLN